MKLKFNTVFRVWMLVLAGMLVWGIWATAQTATNSAPAARSNQPPPFIKDVEQLGNHPLTFRLDRIEFLRSNDFLGEPLWKYAASLVYILMAFYVAKLMDLTARVWLKRLAGENPTKLSQLLPDLLKGPLKLVVFIVLLSVGLNLFQWSDKAQIYLTKGFILVVAASLTYLAVRLTDLLIDLWRRRMARDADQKFDEQLFGLVRKSLIAFIIIVAVLVTAQNLGVNITAAITSLSIGGLAVGLAAQDTLANFFGAVAIFADQPFRVGQQIKLDGAEGLVEGVGLRSTRVRNPDGNLVTVPNKTIANATITNLSRRGEIKTVMNVKLPNELPTAKIKEALSILREVYGGNPMTRDVWVSFNQFTETGINILVTHWWKGTDTQKYLAGMQEMNLAIKAQFDAADIVHVTINRA